jgi:DNA-binding transcriptional ArsR family regulator
MKVADFTNTDRPQLNVRVTFTSAADLLCTLWIIGNDDALVLDDNDLGADWFAEFEERLSPDTLADLDEIGSGDIWVGLIPALPEAGEGTTCDQFIDFVAAMEPADLRYRLIKTFDLLSDVDRSVIADAAEGVPEAIERVLGHESLAKPDMKQWRASLQHLLEMEPAASHDLIVRALSSVQREAFHEFEDEFRPYLEADFRSKKTMERRMSPERLLELTTSGLAFADDHARKPIVLLPTMVARPWVVIAARTDYFILGYPVAEEHLTDDGDAPSPWLVKLHKALGDERRLRIMRTLAQGDATLAELADTVDIAKSTLHHHLMLMRAAGLLRIEVGDDKRYSLRENTLSDAAAMLDYYIHPNSVTEEGP